jgi:hypothetical protein
MPVPFVLAGMAAVSAAGGIKKTWDARGSVIERRQTAAATRERYETALRQLERQRELTRGALVDLGRTKLRVFDVELRRFVTAFERLKATELRPLAGTGAPGEEILPDIELMPGQFAHVDVLKGIVASGGAGALAGMMAYGGVSAFATASTGAAITGLGGAAATNATLAWFGGGAIAAGGFGMQIGAMVLGGVVTGPVLAVAGFLLDARARKALEVAKANAGEVDEAVARLRTMETVGEALHQRARDLRLVLDELRRPFGELVASLERLVSDGRTYPELDDSERGAVMLTVTTASVLKQLMDAPLFDEEGTLTVDSATALAAAHERLRAMHSDDEESPSWLT